MVMRMEAGLDTGPVAMSERMPRRAKRHPPANSPSGWRPWAPTSWCERSVPFRVASSPSCRKATTAPTYAAKLDKAETRIAWARPAADVHNHIRGLSPDPGAWFELDLGKGAERVKALRSTLAEGQGAPARSSTINWLSPVVRAPSACLTSSAPASSPSRRRSFSAAFALRWRSSADAALQAHHRIRRRSFRRLAAPGKRSLRPAGDRRRPSPPSPARPSS